MNNILALSSAAAMLLTAGAANRVQAYEAGDWIGRVGSHYVDPKSDNHDLVNVDAAFGLTGSIVYFVTPTLAVDLLLAYPYSHDINLNSGGEVANTKHLPPTLSLVWYPSVGERLQPFIGAGINYTVFFDEDTRGALDAAKLDLDDSFGFAAVVGVDLAINQKWGVTVDVRYLDISTEASLDGASIGDVEIEPFAYGASLSYRF